MTRDEAMDIKLMVHRARMAQLNAQGGYAHVEKCANGHQRFIDGRRTGLSKCEQCGTQFFTYKPSQRFCREQCRKLWWHHADAERHNRARRERKLRARGARKAAAAGHI